MLLRLQPDCNSSDPLPGLRSCGQVGGPGLGAALLADWSAFVRLSKQKQALAEGLGGGVNTNPFVPAAVSCEEKGNEQGLIISLGGDGWRLWSPRHREAILHTSDILHTPTADPQRPI